MAALKAGLLGYGVMGRHHARVLSGLPGVELVGIFDPEAPFESLDGRRVDSFEELLLRGIDYCVVATPTDTHEQIGLALAHAGVHALIEKPVAMTESASRRLAQAFDRSGLIGAVGHIERFSPSLRRARALIQEGELGRIYHVFTRREGPLSVRIADVGVVKDLATHDIDLSQWLTGARYQSVSARCAYRTGRNHEDLVNVIGEMTGGLLISHIVNWLSPFKVRRSVLVGERGALVADTMTNEVTLYRNGAYLETGGRFAEQHMVTEGDAIRFTVEHYEPLLMEHEAFRDAVMGKSDEVVDLWQGAETIRVAEAILESAKLLGTVRLS